MTFKLSEYKWPAREGVVPMSHQRTTTQFCLQNKRGFVLNEMGTGKTLSVLWASDILFEAKKIRKVLITCTLSTINLVWGREIFQSFPHRRYAVAHGTRAQRIKAIKSYVDFVIINHDGIKIVFDELLEENFDIIIIDELTAFKSHSAERTKVMQKLALSVKAVWGMTGEPTPNNPTEAFSQARIVNPTNPYLPRYFTQFKHLTMSQVTEFMWVPKPEAPQIVSTILRPAVRFRRDECLDLPPTTYTDVEVKMTPQQEEAYKKLRDEYYWMSERGEITVANAAVLLNKLVQVSAGTLKISEDEYVTLDCGPRLQQLLEIFEETPQRKLVVFAAYRATLHMLEQFAQKQKIKAARIYGDVPLKARTDIINNFQEGDLNWIIVQPRSSAHGVDFFSANTIAWYSLIASNEIYNQCNARIIRKGQVRNTLINHLIGSKADQHLRSIINNKQTFSAEVLKLFKERLL